MRGRVGPCACPFRAATEIPSVSSTSIRIVRQRGTGTRPPPGLPTSPCPYRMRGRQRPSSFLDLVVKIHERQGEDDVEGRGPCACPGCHVMPLGSGEAGMLYPDEGQAQGPRPASPPPPVPTDGER